MRHSTSKSFRYAYQGLKTALRNEPNLRIHTFFALLAISLGAFLHISQVEWLVLAFTIFYVISLELLNTVLEAIVDLVSPEIKDAAKTAKDVSAAMVLLAAFFSIVVGIILFLPKLLTLIA